MQDKVLLSDLLGLETWWLIFSNGSSCLTLTLGARNGNRAKESKRKHYPVSQQRPVHCGDVCLSLAELQPRSWCSWLETLLRSWGNIYSRSGLLLRAVEMAGGWKSLRAPASLFCPSNTDVGMLQDLFSYLFCLFPSCPCQLLFCSLCR